MLALVAATMISVFSLLEDIFFNLPLVPLLLAIWSLALFNASQRGGFLKCYPLVALTYLVSNLPYLLSPYFPAGDSYAFHYPTFEYIAEALADGVGFPEWFPVDGGVRIGFSQINLGFALPHRLVGYTLYALLPIPAISAYKIACAVGMLLVGLGWGLYLERLTGSALGSSVGTLAIMLGGTGITTVHQEQVLFTILWLPWILLALYEARSDRRWYSVIAVLLGLAAVTHFPQIYLLALIALAIAAILADPAAVMGRLFSPNKTTWIVALALFLMACAPLLYIPVHFDALMSQHRPIMMVTTYDDYLKLNPPDSFSSAPLWYFRQYLFPDFGYADQHRDMTGLFIGRTTLILAGLALLLRFRRAWPIAMLALIFSLLTMGLRSPLNLVAPLYAIAPPFIGTMREWYHFFPLVNFALAALSAYGVALLIQAVTRLPDHWKGLAVWSLVIFLAVQMFELSAYGRRYFFPSLRIEEPVAVAGRLMTLNHDPSLVQYRHRMFLDATMDARRRADLLEPHNSGLERSLRESLTSVQCCMKTIPKGWVATHNVISIPGPVSEQLRAVVANNRGDQTRYITDIPPSLLPPADGADAAPLSFVAKTRLRHDGANLTIDLSTPALLVTPMNYDLGLTATVDSEPVTVWRVNGALAGIVVPAGEHRVQLRLKNDGYQYLLSAHLIAMTIGILLTIVLLDRKTLRRDPARPSG